MSISANGLIDYTFKRIIHWTEKRFQCNFIFHNNKIVNVYRWIHTIWRNSGGRLSPDTFNRG